MLYFVAFGLALVSVTVAHRLEIGIGADLPMRPALFRAFSGLAGIVATVLFVYGFWIAWFAPFIGFGVGLVFNILWLTSFNKIIAAPAFSIITSIASAVMAGLVLFG